MVSSCVTKTSSRSTLASDLLYVIGPVSENDEDYEGTEKVALCMADQAKSVLTVEEYPSFLSEMQKHAKEMELWLSASDKNLAELPRISLKLDSYLLALVPVVESCESELGVNVEF